MNDVDANGRSAAVRLPWAAHAVVWLLVVVSLYHVRLADPDLWWVVRVGEDILDSGRAHQPDPYSFTAAGRLPIDHEWLSEVAFAAVLRAGGPTGLILLKLIVGLAIAVLSSALLRRCTRDDRIRLPALLLVAHATGRYLLFRPQIFTMLGVAAVLLVLDTWRRAPSVRPLWLLPPLMLVWANVHGGFVIGLALAGWMLVVAPWWRGSAAGSGLGVPAAFVAGSAAVTLLTPFGPSLWWFVATETTSVLNKQYVQEWRPPALWPPDWNGAVLQLAMAFALAAAVAARRRDPADVVLVGAMAAAACTATRHVPLFVLVAAPVIVAWADDWASRPGQGRARHRILACAGSAVLVPALAAVLYVAAAPRPEIRIADDNYGGFPYEAVEFLARQPAGGHVWNELAWGGYALWRLGPAWKVSIDGRNNFLYPKDVIRDHFELFADARPDPGRLERYPIDVCLIDPASGLAAALARDQRWEEAYRDARAVVFRSRASTLALRPASAVAMPPRPAPLVFTGLPPS